MVNQTDLQKFRRYMVGARNSNMPKEEAEE